MKNNKRILAVIATAVLLVSVLAGSLLLRDAPIRAFAQDGSDFGQDQPITGEELQQASQAALDYVQAEYGQTGTVSETELAEGHEEGAYGVEIVLEDGREVEVNLDETFQVIGSEPEEEDAAGEVEDADDVEFEGENEAEDAAEDELEGPDQPIKGSALEQASQAALDYLGEGRVTATEQGDEEGYYEVEITLANGRQVDVHLDENFNVLGQEADGLADTD